ncbi:hypothetical protein PMAC_000356 [Pneumocystis sp. 'macacae']|nr:hypothetical protein PMAC_000356 [Pneumocystis sp. 'macacae']
MALGALARNSAIGLKIVPCGMNYFNAHRFRSRAVLEFGMPLSIPGELVEQYRRGEREAAVHAVLEMVSRALRAVTVRTADYETLVVVQACRRLYRGGRQGLQQAVELNRRFIEGYSQWRTDRRVERLRQAVLAYERELELLGLRDHEVDSARYSGARVLREVVYRSTKFVVLGVLALPGVVLFSPVFAATKIISQRKARGGCVGQEGADGAEALGGSTVKIEGRDVLATWKLLVALALVPALLVVYSGVVACVGVYYGVRCGLGRVGWTYTSREQRGGEGLTDRSLRPLVLSLASADTMERLRRTREELAVELTEVVNALGPGLFADLEPERVCTMPEYMVQEGGAGAGRVDSLCEETEREGATGESFEEVSRRVRRAMRQRMRRRTRGCPGTGGESAYGSVSGSEGEAE